MGCSTCDFTQYEILILIVNHCSIISLFVATYLVLFQKLLGLRVVSKISSRWDTNSKLFQLTDSTLWCSSWWPGCKCCSPWWWWISFPSPMLCTCIGLAEKVFRIWRKRFVCPSSRCLGRVVPYLFLVRVLWSSRSRWLFAQRNGVARQLLCGAQHAVRGSVWHGLLDQTEGRQYYI